MGVVYVGIIQKVDVYHMLKSFMETTGWFKNFAFPKRIQTYAR